MILAFGGDPFLATRAARRALRSRGFRPEEISELAEGMQAVQVARLATQPGLFGRVALYLDFDAAFRGQAGVKPRNEVLRVLEKLPEESSLVVVDLAATASRQKLYRKLGEYQHLPTPRFQALIDWVRRELHAEGIRFRPEVPQVLADLFGEDLPGIASEIQKLAVLDEELSSGRVKRIVNRPAARDAFDLIDATTSGDGGAALAVCRSLLAQGEAPARVLGALNWQYGLVARCVGLRESRGRADPTLVVQTLKVKPFVAKKALAIAGRLDEDNLGLSLRTLQEADIAMKTGGDGAWALESLALKLASLFAPPSG